MFERTDDVCRLVLLTETAGVKQVKLVIDEEAPIYSEDDPLKKVAFHKFYPKVKAAYEREKNQALPSFTPLHVARWRWASARSSASRTSAR